MCSACQSGAQASPPAAGSTLQRLDGGGARRPSSHLITSGSLQYHHASFCLSRSTLVTNVHHLCSNHQHIVPEAWDHLGKADDLLDAVGDQVSQVGQHGQLSVLFTGVWTISSILVHHQKAAEVHLGVHRLCFRESVMRWHRRKQVEERKEVITETEQTESSKTRWTHRCLHKDMNTETSTLTQQGWRCLHLDFYSKQKQTHSAIINFHLQRWSLTQEIKWLWVPVM